MVTRKRMIYKKSQRCYISLAFPAATNEPEFTKFDLGCTLYTVYRLDIIIYFKSDLNWLRKRLIFAVSYGKVWSPCRPWWSVAWQMSLLKSVSDDGLVYRLGLLRTSLRPRCFTAALVTLVVGCQTHNNNRFCQTHKVQVLHPDVRGFRWHGSRLPDCFVIYLVQPYQEEILIWPMTKWIFNPWTGPSCHFWMHEASTTDWSSWLQLLITLSEKKYSRTSLFVQCLVNFSVWPLVLSWFVSWNNDSNGGRDSCLYILKRKIRSALLRLSSKV